MQKHPKLRTALTLLGLTASIGFSGNLAASANTTATDAPGLRSIAFEHYLGGDTEAALDYYQKAIDTASKDYGAESSYIGQLYYEMGTLALDAKKFVRSEAYLQKAVQHNPNSVMARVKFAELLQLRGKNDEALQQIHAALTKHSSSPEAREALVIWLQANHKTARAIHESYNISVAAAGNTVAPPSVTTVVAKTESPKPADTALIAAAGPAPTPAPAPPAAKVPLKIFPWMMPEKKPEKKVEPEKKPPEKKEEKKPVESKKPEKKAKKEPKQAKPTKDKHTKQSKQQAEQVAQEEMHALRTTAKALPKKKEARGGDDPAESGATEEAAAPPAKVKRAQAAAPVMPPAPTMVFNVPVVKSSKRSPSMVPPPPPTVPFFGGPMGMFQPPPSLHQPVAPKAAKKPKAAAPAIAKEPAPEKPAAASSSGGEEPNPDFLLEWGGANNKKKGK